MTDLLKDAVGDRAISIYERASGFSNRTLTNCASAIERYAEDNALSLDDVCFIAVGSVGRREALDASDIDLIPILGASVEHFDRHDAAIRDIVGQAMQAKVSNGDDLTKFTHLTDLANGTLIGADDDNSSALTKRVLILTEGAQAGGRLPIHDVREKLLRAYAQEVRTRGRHLLALINDIARYYRTLCIEYKAKVESGKDWCTRNVKLRHSRKFWYFSTMLALAASRGSGDAQTKSVLALLQMPPCERLLSGLGSTTPAAARRVLEAYAWFLDFMSKVENRAALSAVDYDQRYEATIANPFPAMKANSDLLHREMLTLLDSVERPVRDRVLDWFLL